MYSPTVLRDLSDLAESFGQEGFFGRLDRRLAPLLASESDRAHAATILTGRPPAASDPLEAIYLGEIERLRPVAEGRAALAPRGALVSSTGEDVLVEGVDKMPVAKLILASLLRSMPATKGIALVTTTRDEGRSIIEWLAFHRLIGVEHVFVYTNDNTDGSSDLLRLLQRHGIISLIDNQVDPRVAPQHKAYEHALYALPELRAHGWVGFTDVDEFIRLRGPEQRLAPLLDEVAATPGAGSLFLQWRWFGSDGHYALQDGLVVETYRHSRPDRHGKSLSRLRDVLSMRPVHYPTLVPGRQILDSALRPVEPAEVAEPRYARAQINHYWNKSFEDFVLKRAKGNVALGLANGGERQFRHFFEWDVAVSEAAFEPMDRAFLERLREEVRALRALDGVDEAEQAVRVRARDQVGALAEDFDPRALHAAGARAS